MGLTHHIDIQGNATKQMILSIIKTKIFTT